MRTLIAFSIVLLLALITFLGCEQPTVNSPTKEAVVLEGDSSLLKGPPSSYPNPVTVTFADANGDNIRSDGKGPYVDKEEGVKAYINTTYTNDLLLHTDGNLKVKDVKKGAVPRMLIFKLDDPVGDAKPLGEQTVVAFLNVDKLFDVNSATGRAQFNAKLNGGGILRYGYELGDGTDPVEVTGTPETGPWYVTTTGNGIAKLMKFKGNRLIDLGNYYLPFSITVELLPQ